jgi:tRNA pseudouridine55 synthase
MNVLQEAKPDFLSQVGHAGTLDPMATGLLIICTGRGTKQIDSFVAMEKAYTGTLRLGQATPSYDAMTAVEEELPWERITGGLIAVKQHFLFHALHLCMTLITEELCFHGQ